MNLPYSAERDSKIKGASLPIDSSNVRRYELWRDQLMKEFWTLFEREYEGNIPPGLIFLPGEKLALQGFGWAPRSFMEAYKLDHPDPFIKGPSWKPTRLNLDF